jgi:hypothetical protein
MTPGPTRAAVDGDDIERYVTLLEIEEVILGVSQTDIASLETVLDLGPPTEAGAVGSIRRGSDTWPVFCLSQDLVVLDYAPATRRVCALLKDQARRLGLLVDRVESVAGESLQVFARTGTVARIPAPIRALARWDDRLVSLVPAASLAGIARRQAATIAALTGTAATGEAAEPHAHVV